jgi:hypothetical protein
MCGERQMRGPNDQTQVKVTYVSGRSEINLFNTAANGEKEERLFLIPAHGEERPYLKKEDSWRFHAFCERQGLA